jgi:ABC-type ATPase involved in cell division
MHEPKLILNRQLKALSAITIYDNFIKASENAFDCTFDGVSTFSPWEKPDMPENFGIGVIVGGSGTGKSTLLKEFGVEESPTWDLDKAVISHFESPDEAINKLGAVGLNTVPSWYKPYHVLSTGEKFRVDLAKKIKDYAVIDEFTSVVDRNVAKAASMALSRYIKTNKLSNIVLATCHYDIIDWLEPDWVIDTNSGQLYDGFFLSDQKLISKYIVQTEKYGKCLKTITI